MCVYLIFQCASHVFWACSSANAFTLQGQLQPTPLPVISLQDDSWARDVLCFIVDPVCDLDCVVVPGRMHMSYFSLRPALEYVLP